MCGYGNDVKVEFKVGRWAIKTTRWQEEDRKKTCENVVVDGTGMS